ncbi:PepSY domain-containing protein [Sphingomonas sp. A2-49]|uniref:PepSY-associated TM helix domain-containing protein n=1 Tax=Sphingomonas sp. A2-49 TaxID=1391375 RepID=UPI0021D1761B|nr:PepSY-associated TM helix domain-containing protein [Sphingomonas sp. A2-49]MCU6454734.1 PepSY domain-containing protein [Sphingomonas sp. A2-49]
MTTGVQRVRVAIRRMHVWLGLGIGLLFVVTGLTGSGLVFYPAIDTMLDPALARVDAAARPASWQAVYDALRRDNPARTGAWRIEATPDGGPIPVRYYRPVETRGRAFAPLMLWLDPATLHAVRRGFWGEYATTWLYDLHYRLLLGEAGGTAMGIAGIVMLVLLVSGLWAWWPRHGGWRRSLAWKRGAVASRRLYDIHKWAGIAGAVVLIVVTVTGILLDLPDPVRATAARVSPLATVPPMASVPRPAGFLPLDALVARARRLLPGSTLAWIETPADAHGVVRVNLMVPGEPSRRFPRSNVWLDPYDGRVLAVRDQRGDGGGDTVLAWLHPLHGGEALGLGGRWLVFVSGLLPALLFATGCWRWIARRRRHSGAVREPSPR